MPLQSYQTFRRIVKLCRASVPPEVYAALEPITTNDQAVKEYGVELAVSMIRKLRAGGVNGFHFCTLNLEKSVKRILYALEWAEDPGASSTPAAVSQIFYMLVQQCDQLHSQSTSGLGVPDIRRDHSSWAWDEFPNGRLGDVRSPAYGELDGWGVSLKLTPQKALAAWGRPTQASDITGLFSAYLSGTLATLPWCAEPLLGETASIAPQLSKLTEKNGWWTVGSQPAVDGVRSDDVTYGFGPKGGYIYQKSFVEFWATSEDVRKLSKRINDLERENGCREVTFYAAAHPKYEKNAGWMTNMDKGDANAVTWGIFAGKEIVTTTLIEEVSFKAWRVRSDQSFEHERWALTACDSGGSV